MNYEPVFVVAVVLWTALIAYVIFLDIKLRKLEKLLREVEGHEDK